MMNYLICEICYSAIGQFEPYQVHQPISGEMFQSPRPAREVPAPFDPVADWEHMRCRVCAYRPIIKPDRLMIEHPRCFETAGKGPTYHQVPSEQEQPAQSNGQVVEQMMPPPSGRKRSSEIDAGIPDQPAEADAGAEPTGEPDPDEPFICPDCGKEYKQYESFVRYHQSRCPKAS